MSEGRETQALLQSQMDTLEADRKKVPTHSSLPLSSLLSPLPQAVQTAEEVKEREVAALVQLTELEK